jgi:hypothetical protein
MVDHIEDWWGPSAAWDGAANLTDHFAAIDPKAAMEIITLRRSDPDLAKYPPKPAELAAAAHRLGVDQGRVLTAPCDHTYDGRYLHAGAGRCARCHEMVELPE